MEPPTSPDRYTAGDDPAEWVRKLAGLGVLAQYFASATPAEAARLRAGAYQIIVPVVFERLTRGIEYGRGHRRCAISPAHLEFDCVDGFHNDVEAVLHDLLRNAKKPIHNVEGWITRRLVAVTVDQHRRQRGEIGAPQRPRLSGWLVELLHDDPWLTSLALEMMIWVGVPASAGTDVWPLTAWTGRRIVSTGDPYSSEADTARDVATVLAAMRHRPRWYEQYILRPLGHKPAPTVSLDLVEPGLGSYDSTTEGDDHGLLDLASVAIDAIQARLRRGENPETVVTAVLKEAFGSGTGAEDVGRLPGTGSTADEQVSRLLADPAAFKRLVGEILDILRGDAR